MSKEATQDLIGKLLPDAADRDAIHIAVAPMVALRTCNPGARIGLTDGKADPLADHLIGIADPFLKAPAKPGERFFMFLYPNTATGLRHVYTHPELDAGDSGRAESEQWLRAFAERLFSYDPDYGSRFDVLMANAESGGFGTDIEYGPDCEPTDEFWMHFERYTGRKVLNRPAYFRCAC
jgi:hypothetical protein